MIPIFSRRETFDGQAERHNEGAATSRSDAACEAGTRAALLK
jgi:hypothetical protein